MKSPDDGVLISENEAELFMRLLDKYYMLQDGFEEYMQLKEDC